MFRRLFLDHPEQLGESYAEHFATATRFGLAMVIGGVACTIHAFVPAWFKTTGSETVLSLHRRMIAKRGAARAANLQLRTVDWVI